MTGASGVIPVRRRLPLLMLLFVLASCSQFDDDPDEGDLCSNAGEIVVDEQTGETFICTFGA